MANSHPGSYCGQDAYNDMLITEKKNVLRDASNRNLQGFGAGIVSEEKGSQGRNRSNSEGGATWKLLFAD